MNNLLFKLIVLVSIAQLGLSLTDLLPCRSEPCAKKLNEASRKVLSIDWKPISVFPEEARRFK